MDSDRFDLVARAFVTPGSRRRMLASLLAGAVGLAGSRGTDARTCSAIGNICREHANCCSGTCGPRDRTGRRWCQCDSDADCPADHACENGSCVVTCQSSGACETDDVCCPGLSCSGGGNPEEIVCQDCNVAPTLAGEFCSASIGNQCCGGNVNCFVAVTLGGDPICVSGADCNESEPCTATTGCDIGQVCARVNPASGCCSSPTTETICVTPCGGTS